MIDLKHLLGGTEGITEFTKDGLRFVLDVKAIKYPEPPEYFGSWERWFEAYPPKNMKYPLTNGRADLSVYRRGELITGATMFYVFNDEWVLDERCFIEEYITLVLQYNSSPYFYNHLEDIFNDSSEGSIFWKLVMKYDLDMDSRVK